MPNISSVVIIAAIVPAVIVQMRTNRVILLADSNPLYVTRVSKNIPDIIDRHLEKGYRILIIFGKNISNVTVLQTAIQFPTSPNVCFCTTWPTRRSL